VRPCQGRSRGFKSRFPLQRRHSQEVRQRSAKPLFSGSNPDAASSYSKYLALLSYLQKIPGIHIGIHSYRFSPTIALIEAFVKADKPVGAVCHAPAAFVNVRGNDGEYLVKGKRVTGFANAEEEVVGLTAVVPFLLENRLKERGAISTKAANWAPYVQVDGKLATGQNPASSGPAAEELLKLLRSV
jgi:hypothetical protein